jgi:hypothetical protein
MYQKKDVEINKFTFFSFFLYTENKLKEGLLVCPPKTGFSLHGLNEMI